MSDLLYEVEKVSVVVRPVGSPALFVFGKVLVGIDDELNGELAEQAVEMLRDSKSLRRMSVGEMVKVLKELTYQRLEYKTLFKIAQASNSLVGGGTERGDERMEGLELVFSKNR